MKTFKYLLILSFMFSVSALSPTGLHATLLVNGDFDAGDYGLTGRQWGLFDSIVGWHRVDGLKIEVQRNTLRAADTGNYYVELDGLDNTDIMQSAFFSPGWYNLSFAYQPRTRDDNDNGIGFTVGDWLSEEVDGNKKTWSPAGWHHFAYNFEVQKESWADVMFSAFGNSNALGGLLDSISLTQTSAYPPPTPTPEPGTLLLLGTGLFGVVLYRKKKKIFN